MKLFQKRKTIEAKKNAELTLENAKKTLEAAKAEVLTDNNRANRKAVHTAERKVEHATARIGHINVALDCQSEKHDKKFVQKKKEVIPMKKSRKMKTFNKASIAKPLVRQRSVWKDAKESAYWMRKLLNEKEAAEVQTNRNLPVVNMISKVDFAKYYGDLCKVRKFSGTDKTYEMDRRRRENVAASEQLGHPAMQSAMVFSNGLMAAGNILGKNPGELGGKHLFEGIAIRNDAINDMVLELKDLKKELDELWQAAYDDAAERIAECKKFGAYNDLDTAEAIFANDKAYCKVVHAKIRVLSAQKNELTAEVKVLRAAVKELMDGASKDEAALIKARCQVAAKKLKDKKSEAYGRPINPAAKPMLKSYKLMHFDSEAIVSVFTKVIKDIRDAYEVCRELQFDEEATDDAKKAARQNLIEKFDDAVAFVNEYRENGKKLRIDAAKAKIHNARQSQLTDVISVPYGKTTDMILSFSHAVASIFNQNMAEYLNDDVDEGSKMIDALMEAIVSIATLNGIELKTTDSKGNPRYLEYKFWNANNSQLKVGKGVALSKEAYERAAEVARAGMTEKEFEELWGNGSDFLKWWSYATTPGAPLMYQGKPLTADDVLVVKSIEVVRKFRNVLVYDPETGKCQLKAVEEISRTAFDGQIFFIVPIPSQQLRGAFSFKGFGVCCANDDGTTMIDETAAREGWEIPEFIEDAEGILREWRNYKVICTEDCWKWAGWKFGPEKRKFTYTEFRQRMKELTKKYPCANMLYTARIADATEESKRRLTRQSTQQFPFATIDQIAKLGARSINKIKKLSTHEGVIRMMAGLDKPEEERTDFEHLIEVCPELLDHPFTRRAVEDTFNRKVAEAAVRPEVDGIYPYICEDPVAFFKIVLWKQNPNKTKLGYLNQQQVNVPNEKEGTPLYIVRYPNNYVCGQIKWNHNDDIYRCVGNVMVLSIDGGVLIRADGDTDGDEMCVIRDTVVVEMMMQTINELRPPIIKFPHDKLEKNIIRGAEARAKELAHAIVVANKFGPEVGKNSNLATKFMHRVSLAINAGINWKRDLNLKNAIVAHIAAIIAIDLAKTGKMPDWLMTNLNEIKKYAGKKMPWNQRFCKDNKSLPWFSEAWDDITLPESDGVVDRIARYVVDTTDAANYKCPTGDGFDITSILGRREGLIVNGSTGKLENKKVRSLEARNYRTKQTNSEGDDEFKLINNLKSDDPEKRIGPHELARFLWRNQASLVYVLQKDGSDKLDQARMQNSYYEFCNELLLNFGGYCSGNKAFANKPVEIQKKSNLWNFVTMAFDLENGIGCKCGGGEDSEEAFSKKASFCMFIIKVFAYDLYQLACDVKGVEDRWVKPIESENVDNADVGGCEEVVSIDIGYREDRFCDEIDC